MSLTREVSCVQNDCFLSVKRLFWICRTCEYDNSNVQKLKLFMKMKKILKLYLGKHQIISIILTQNELNHYESLMYQYPQVSMYEYPNIITYWRTKIIGKKK